MDKKITFKTPNVLGGFGEKKSNRGTQWYQQDRVYDSKHLSMCLPAAIPGGSYRYLIKDKEINMAEFVKKITDELFQKLRFSFRIRKLTPEECFVLQGFTISDCIKARNLGISNSQLYKQAGNGLSSNVVQFIGEHMRKMYDETYETTDEKMVKIYGECD